eukprot:COSAG02_NODE_5461_length_4300_cov_29.607712_1_plen_122_part_00
MNGHAVLPIVQMEQTEAQLQSKVNDIRDQVGIVAQHMERLIDPAFATNAGLEVELPGGGTGRAPSKLPPIENRPEMADAGLGESASTPARVPPTGPSKESERSKEPAPSLESAGGRKPRQP